MLNPADNNRSWKRVLFKGGRRGDKGNKWCKFHFFTNQIKSALDLNFSGMASLMLPTTEKVESDVILLQTQSHFELLYRGKHILCL